MNTSISNVSSNWRLITYLHSFIHSSLVVMDVDGDEGRVVDSVTNSEESTVVVVFLLFRLTLGGQNNQLSYLMMMMIIVNFY